VTSLLDVRALTVELPTPTGGVRPVNDVSLHIDAGESLGLVGESGSGKTMLALALMGLLPVGARVSGEACLRREMAIAAGGASPAPTGASSGKNLTALSEREWRSVRGGEIAMVFQEPMTSLNPVMRVGKQIEEAIRAHESGVVAGDEARELRKSYRRGGGAFSNETVGPRFTAVDGVSLEVQRGETFAVVGESGCGKTTLARMLLRLIEPDSGELRFEGRDLLGLSGGEIRAERRQMQMVFQDPFASLDPRMRVGEIVGEPLEIHHSELTKTQKQERTAAMLQRVGLGADAVKRYPHEFSGGQRQRIGIARALILRPKLVVADEPVSALDVSVGAQVLLLLQELQREFGLTYIFISHSLPVVAQVATRIAVMRAGKFVEVGSAEQVLHQPSHAYTRELLGAVPALPGR
jgi:oligopeptide transport system ATP-binding protein